MKAPISATILLLAIAVVAIGQETQTKDVALKFIGEFVLSGATGDLRFDPHGIDQPTLTLAQTSGGLRVTRMVHGDREEMVLPFDGSEIDYTTIKGHAAKAMLRAHGKNLEITEDIQGKDFPRVPKSHIHSVDRWSLSGDAKTLKICGYADSLGGIVQFRLSGCQIFKRR